MHKYRAWLAYDEYGRKPSSNHFGSQIRQNTRSGERWERQTIADQGGADVKRMPEEWSPHSAVPGSVSASVPPQLNKSRNVFKDDRQRRSSDRIDDGALTTTKPKFSAIEVTHLHEHDAASSSVAAI